VPTVRALSDAHDVSRGTAWRALRALEAEGLIAAQSRHGYRVLARANDPDRGCPVAYVLSAQRAGAEWTGLNRVLLTALQSAAARRGWTLLGAGAAGLSPEALVEQCKAARAWGVVVDVHSPGMVRLARRAGLAVVMVDAWHEDADVDAIVQDGFRGGFLAAKHLAEHGHRRIGWFGPTTASIHAMTRFSGALAGLRRHGIAIPPELLADVEEEGAADAARAMLSRPDRPSAAIALWREQALAVAGVAGELGLVLGRDLELVGWCAEELYAGDYAGLFPDGRTPPTIVWKVATLAETAIGRLAERRANPKSVPMLINIRTELKIAGSPERGNRASGRET